jgi:hypothetical protein
MHEQFDDIVRLVASPISKRQILRLVGGMLVGNLVSLLWPGRIQAAAIHPRQRAQNTLLHFMQGACPTLAPVPCQNNPNAPRECCTQTEVCCSGSFGNGCCNEGWYCPAPGSRRCTECPTGRRRPGGPGPHSLRCAGRECCPSNRICAYWNGPRGTCVTNSECVMINGDPCGSWCCRPGVFCLYSLPTPTTPSYASCGS